MKTMLQHNCKINLLPALRRARDFRFASAVFRFALAVLLLGAAGGGFSRATAGSFPSLNATDEQNVQSFGLFKILVRQQ